MLEAADLECVARTVPAFGRWERQRDDAGARSGCPLIGAATTHARSPRTGEVGIAFFVTEWMRDI
jgi:hypothetical protein